MKWYDILFLFLGGLVIGIVGHHFDIHPLISMLGGGLWGFFYALMIIMPRIK